MRILVGADPEVFMVKDGKPVSAHGAVTGTKHHPYKVNKGAVQVDGMALEFNIDPADSEATFVDNIESVMATLKEMVPGYDLVPMPVAEFGKSYMKKQPLESKILGCDPDYNAWNGGKPNPRPDGENSFRTGAGHVHIGWTKDANQYSPAHVEASIMLTKQLDFCLGLPSLLYDKSAKRRTMYGAPGAFRPKPYGVEYRVLSNAWLSDPKLIRWVFQNTIMATERLLEGYRFYERIDNRWLREMEVSRPKLQLIKRILNKFEIPLPPVVA